MSVVLNTRQVLNKNFCWYFSGLVKMEFDKDYFPSGVEGSRELAKSRREKMRTHQVKAWGLLAGEKSMVLCKQESMVNKI